MLSMEKKLEILFIHEGHTLTLYFAMSSNGQTYFKNLFLLPKCSALFTSLLLVRLSFASFVIA